jgi:ABC-type glutathione transport system ATPase component
MSEPISDQVVRVENLRKEFPGHRGAAAVAAVDGVGFELASGEALAIVGESGSGKTTVARMLMGLERPTSGTIEVCGRQRSGRPSTAERRRRAREVQLVFQDPFLSLDRAQRIGSAIETAIRLQFPVGRDELRRRTSELLEQVGLLPRHAELFPRQLSGGQRQRVAIARALAAEPSVLVLDEAVAALDVSIQAQILNLLCDIRETREIAYLFISHDLAVVNQLCERTIVMRRGKVVEAGATRELLTAPAEDYTRRLIDAVPRPGWVPTRSRDLAGA